MEGVVQLDMSFDSIIRYAECAIDEEKPLLGILNLNEALPKAETREQKRRVYSLYIECFRMSSNMTSIMHAIMLEVMHRVDEDFYRFDFSLKKHAVRYEEDCSIDYREIRLANDIKNLIAERRYNEADALFSTMPAISELYPGIVDALNDAVDFDKEYTTTGHIMSVVPLMASENKAEVVRLMLSGGSLTHQMIVEGVEILLANDDSNTLCLIGIAFFENNELAIAARFFRKALDLDPIDEDALYYMSVIKILIKDDVDDVDYWGRYKTVYKVTEPPIRMTEEFFNSEYIKTLVPYRTLPPELLQLEATKLVLDANDEEDISEEKAQLLSDFCKLAREQEALVVLEMYGNPLNKPVLLETLKRLLSSARVADGIKESIVSVLVSCGYEGEIAVLTEERAVVMKITKLHKRVHKAWNMLYRYIVKTAPFSDVYIPIKCADLAYVTKKLDGLIIPDEEDMHFCHAMLIINYLKRIKLNADYIATLRGLDIDITDIGEKLQKFELKSIFIQ